MGLQNKVIQLNTFEETNVWGCIKTFLDRIEQDSVNTRKTYERAIRNFFLKMRNKNIEDLSEKDLVFTKRQIQTYQVELRNEFKSTTVNNRISILKKLYLKLNEYEFDVNPSWFDLDRYDEHDKESYDTLSHEEVVEVIDLVSKTRKGFEKSLLLRVAYSTAFRKTAIQNLEWSDVINKEGQWFLKALDKGNKWDYKKISDELYSELIKLKDTNDKKIFSLTNKTINRMFNYIRDNMDFGERNIVFHSFKKASINEVALLTNYDLKAMQQQGNHASIVTTLNDYMKDKSLEDLIVVDINYEVPINKLDDLSKEELLNIIKSSDRNTQIKLLQTANMI